MKTLKKTNYDLEQETIKVINKKFMDLALTVQMEGIKCGQYFSLEGLIFNKFKQKLKAKIIHVFQDVHPEKVNRDLDRVLNEILDEFKQQIGKNYEKNDCGWN